MTIDEAIERYTSNAEYERTHGNLQGCLDFRQLAEWLKDYKRLKEQEPTGHWNLFHITEHGMREDSYFKCNRCNYESYKEYNFCPDCGAKMVEPQESEDKE